MDLSKVKMIILMENEYNYTYNGVFLSFLGICPPSTFIQLFKSLYFNGSRSLAVSPWQLDFKECALDCHERRLCKYWKCVRALQTGGQKRRKTSHGEMKYPQETVHTHRTNFPPTLDLSRRRRGGGGLNINPQSPPHITPKTILSQPSHVTKM